MFAAGWPDAVGEAVDLAVAQRRAVLVGLEFGGEREVGELPVHRGEQLLHRGARAGARVADVEALALEVGERLDVRFLAGDDGDRLGVQREHGALLGPRAGILERRVALHRVVLDVGLREAHVELAGADGVGVEHRGAGRLDRAADAVLGTVLVDEAADRAAGRVVDAGDATGADGDELLLRGGRRAESAAGERRRGNCECHAGNAEGSHDNSPRRNRRTANAAPDVPIHNSKPSRSPRR